MTITTATTDPPITTADFDWGEVTQAQMGVSVNSLIKLIKEFPRPVVEMSLEDWEVVDTQFVQHTNGPPMGFHAQRVPASSIDLFPVIVCVANGTTLVFDGNHRLAYHLINNLPSIKAVVVTEEEARFCISGLACGLTKRLGWNHLQMLNPFS